jgi:3-methyl-2-oxobutanoate hydroxymethyltransferase
MARRTTIRTLQQRRDAGTPITMVTAYDVTFARLFDEAGVDALLVGDSLGNVIAGFDSTLPVDIDHIAWHTAAVARGAKRAHIVADLPFGSYGASVDASVEHAVTLMKAGAHAVKLEGGAAFAETVRRMTDIGIPVMGHLGLTPQSVHKLGGYRVQGRGDAGEALLADALALQEAGVYAIVFEMVPAPLARRVTDALDIPTIGIGAGNGTSGQVLVGYDMLGMNDGFQPTFLKTYARLADTIRDATRAYCDEVRSRTFPDDAHSFDAEDPS